jgi:glycosyltransferase involved in cell wall biosynthesis
VSSLKVSIITVSLNSAKTITDTINSVLNQTYPDIEYIVIDGVSSDGTQDIVTSFGKRVSKFISEPDKGLYDAINKGIKIATGDVVGILNSDDFFCDNNVIEQVAGLLKDDNIDAVFGDVQFIDPAKSSKIVRYYSSKHFKLSKFKFGYMPAHPSFYARRELFEKLGYYKTDYKIAADFELLLRFMLINKIKCVYLEMPFISMRTGGISNKSIWSNFTLNKEIAKACRENGIGTNYLFIYSKYFTKIFDFIGKRARR